VKEGSAANHVIALRQHGLQLAASARSGKTAFQCRSGYTKYMCGVMPGTSHLTCSCWVNLAASAMRL
jgi:hypothetical protein